ASAAVLSPPAASDLASSFRAGVNSSSGNAYRSDAGSAGLATGEIYRDDYADLRERAETRFFAGRFPTRLFGPLFSTDALSASMRSTTFGVSLAVLWIVTVLPFAFFLIRSWTRLRYSS